MLMENIKSCAQSFFLFLASKGFKLHGFSLKNVLLRDESLLLN